MRLHKTGHAIADTVSDLIGELPDETQDLKNIDRGKRCEIVYGILRHDKFITSGNWFEIDKGFWGSGHYDGNYRISYRGTQQRFSPDAPSEPHGLTLEPWRNNAGGYTLICPPTQHVCQFFGLDFTSWLMNALMENSMWGKCVIRHKGEDNPVDWDSVRQVVTFNSTIAVEALRRGIPVISDPDHSSIGSYMKYSNINSIDMNYREPLFCFLQAHQFKLHEKEKIWSLVRHYLYSSDSIPEKQ